MDIFITPAVAEKIKHHKRVYTRFKPQEVLCITDTPKVPQSGPSFHGESWYFCPHCKVAMEYYEMYPTLTEGIRLCPNCYGAIGYEY